MSELRKAAEAALEALEMEATSPPIPETAAAITALRAALAQPEPESDLRKAAQQMVVAMESYPHSMTESPEGCWNYTRDLALDALRAALAQPEQLMVGGDDLPTLTKWTPQRKPLTDEEIELAYREIWRDLSDGFSHTSTEWIEAGIRYAEKVHGIE